MDYQLIITSSYTIHRSNFANFCYQLHFLRRSSSIRLHTTIDKNLLALTYISLVLVHISHCVDRADSGSVLELSDFHFEGSLYTSLVGFQLLWTDELLLMLRMFFEQKATL